MADPGTRRRGPSLALSLVVLALGALVAVPIAVVLGVRAYRVIDSPAVDIPGATQRHLRAGTWVVYQLTGTTTAGFGLSINTQEEPDLQPAQVVVTAPDGTRVAVRPVSENDTVTRNSEIFVSALEFRAPAPGRYSLTFQPAESGKVLVAPSVGDTFGSLAGLLGALGVGSLLGVLGLVLLCVGVVRRSRAAHATAAAATPAPGWYPDPYAPGTRRWWDGRRWSG